MIVVRVHTAATDEVAIRRRPSEQNILGMSSWLARKAVHFVRQSANGFSIRLLEERSMRNRYK